MMKNNFPRVSLLLICYNQQQYIRDAVSAALAQTYKNLQVVISDDCSTDSTYDILNNIVCGYNGIHDVVLSQTAINSGINGNINHAMSLCDGEFIVAAAGDDVSLPGRVEQLMDFWVRHDCVFDYMYSDFYVMSPSGAVCGRQTARIQLHSTLEQTARLGCVATGASEAWSKRIWNRFGPLPLGFAGEDAVLAFRARLSGGIGYVELPLLKWRSHVSTWVENNRVSPEALRRRFFVLSQHMVADALANRDDIIRLGFYKLLPHIDGRVREMNFVNDIAAGKSFSLFGCIQAVRSGMRPKTVFLYYFLYRFTAIAIVLIMVRNFLLHARRSISP